MGRSGLRPYMIVLGGTVVWGVHDERRTIEPSTELVEH
jgi:hypothetical protein